MDQGTVASHKASHFPPRVGVLWEGHMSDPCRDRVHVHSCTPPMAIWRSTSQVRAVLV
jgi:hypothetical protein